MTAAAKRNLLLAAIPAAVAVFAGLSLFAQRAQPVSVAPLHHDAAVVAPNGARYDVEIADDDAERMLGLSFRPSMAETEGKLFVFPDAGRHAFWMKDMKYPLDMLWIQDGVVVDLAVDVPAPLLGQFPATVTPKADASEVLELRAGEAKRQGITRGTALDIRMPSGYSWPAN